MNYYCRLCDEFIEEDEVVRELKDGAITTPIGNMFELHETCPLCGNILFEEADECICGKFKLVNENLCRNCHKVAEDEWQRCLKMAHARIKTIPSDAEDVMKLYVRKEILHE